MFFEVQPTVSRISKGCCQCGSQFLTTRFKHSYDQVTFRIALFNITITVTEIVLIQMFCLTVGSKQIKKMKTENTIAPSYHLKVRSTQDKRVLFFSCLGISIISV